jgi:tetratricopeptide (TPR) repeat protein
MPEIIQCPHCQRRLLLRDESWDRDLQCSFCGNSFRLDAAGSSPSGPESVADVFVVDDVVSRPADDDKDDLAERDREPRKPNRVLRRRPSERRRNRVSRAALGLAISTVAVISVIGGWQFIAQQERERREVVHGVVPIDVERRHREIVEAFHRQRPLTEPEIAKESNVLFAELGAALHGRNQKRIVDQFDLDRMYDEIIAQPGLPRHLVADRRSFIQGIRIGFGRAITEQAVFLEWTKTEVKHIRKLTGNEAILIARHSINNQTSVKMRWWITKRPGQWKVFDFEDLDTGLRFSATAAIVVAGGMKDAHAMGTAVTNLRDALADVIIRKDAASATQKLRLAEGVKLPAQLEAFRSMVTGIVRLNQGKAEEAIKALDHALACHPNMIGAEFLRGVAFNQLKKHEKALQHLKTYMELLGDDDLICDELGRAYQGLGRFQEAAAAFRKSLDLNPRQPDTFFDLLRCLGVSDDKSDLGDRFLKLPDPLADFERMAEDCAQAFDHEELKQLAEAMRKLEPAHAAAHYYLALARAWFGQVDQALALFKTALANEKDVVPRRKYTAGFMRAMAEIGKFAKAYQTAPEPKAAFAHLAAVLRNTQPSELKQLLALHAGHHADDPMVALYQGEMLSQERKYELADRAFTKALATPPDKPTLDSFRWRIVETRFTTGKALAAYNEIGPKEDTFRQLADLCLRDRKYALLNELLNLHAKTDARNREVFRYRCLMKIKQGKYLECANMIRAALSKESDEKIREQITASFIYAMVDHGKGLEAYEAIPDADMAFRLLASDLRGQERLEQLRRLVKLNTARRPDGPRLGFAAAEIHIADKAWDQAVKAFANAWTKADKTLKDRYRYRYVFAMYRAGQAQEALTAIEPMRDTFAQLVNLLIQDKKAAELEMLIECYRARADGDSNLLLAAARAKALLKQPEQAVSLFKKAYESEPYGGARDAHASIFLREMAAAGFGLEAYHAVPDKYKALEHRGGLWQFQKNTADLTRLLDEYGRTQMKLPAFWYYQGQLALLRQDLPSAENHFTAALAMVPWREKWRYRDGLFRTRIQAGKVGETYRQFGADSRTFQNLAQLCLIAKDSGQLAALIAIHRPSHPDDKNVVAWEADVKWLHRDYEGTLRFLRNHRQGIFAEQQYKWKFENYLVRCLVKLNRTQEAIEEAREIVTNPAGNPVLLVLAHASAGDVKQAIANVEKHFARYIVTNCYTDEDLGPILRSDAYREFRARFPEPAQSTDFPIDD